MDGIQVSTGDGLTAMQNGGYNQPTFIGSMFSNYVSWTFETGSNPEDIIINKQKEACDGSTLTSREIYTIEQPYTYTYVTDYYISGFLGNQQDGSDNTLTAGGGKDVTLRYKPKPRNPPPPIKDNTYMCSGEYLRSLAWDISNLLAISNYHDPNLI